MPTALVTRAAADAAPFCRALEAYGLTPIRVPLLARTLHLDAVGAASARGHDGWVLTSPASVAALADTTVRPRWIACVGPRTAQAARDAGFVVDLVPPTATAAALVAALGDRTGERILYPHADLAPAERVTALAATGARVDPVVAYTNAEPPGAAAALERVWPPDAVPLLSGSAVRRLVRHRAAPWPRATRVTAIGPSTARVAADLGLRVAAVASPHTAEALAAVTAQAVADP